MLSLTICHCHVKKSSVDQGGWVPQHIFKPIRAKAESRNFKEIQLLAYCFCTQERKQLVIASSTNVSFRPFVLLSFLPSVPLPSYSLVFLLPSCSMFLQTCVSVALCWSRPCQCGPCRRCWLTLGRTTKGWVLPSFSLILHRSLCLSHINTLNTCIHKHIRAHSRTQINL